MSNPSDDLVLSPSALKVLRAVSALPFGAATYRALLIRVRPMSDEGLTRSACELSRKGLIYLSDADGSAVLTDAGRDYLDDVVYDAEVARAHAGIDVGREHLRNDAWRSEL